MKHHGLWIMLVVVFYFSLFGGRPALPAEPDAQLKSVSADPTVLQIEIFVPKSEGIEIGPNIRLEFIDEKAAISTQFKPAFFTTTDFILKNAANTTKVIATLHGEAPPYVVEFEQSVSAVQSPRSPLTRQKVEFPLGQLTRVRLFDFFEVQGFYANPQQRRP